MYSIFYVNICYINIYIHAQIYIHICIERYTNVHIYPRVDTESYFLFIEAYASKSIFYSRTRTDVNYKKKLSNQGTKRSPLKCKSYATVISLFKNL